MGEATGRLDGVPLCLPAGGHLSQEGFEPSAVERFGLGGGLAAAAVAVLAPGVLAVFGRHDGFAGVVF